MLWKIAFWALATVIIFAVGFFMISLMDKIFESPDLGVAFGLVGAGVWSWIAWGAAFAIYNDRFDN